MGMKISFAFYPASFFSILKDILRCTIFTIKKFTGKRKWSLWSQFYGCKSFYI